MSRREKLILVKDQPNAIIDALDAILETQGFWRTAVQTIREDFTPLLAEPGGPLAFVLAMPRNEWVACWTSLSFEAEWDLAEALARGLEQPLVYALFDDDNLVYLYRYFENGALHEEALPDAPTAQPLDEAGLFALLERHGVDPELVDDRTQGFGEEHLVVGYTRRSADVEAMAGPAS